MIGAVGEVFRFEADGTAFGKCGAMCASASTAVVSGIALNTWFGGPAFHRAATHGVYTLDSETQFSRLPLVEYPAMVIAIAVFGLLPFFNSFSDFVRCAEIK